MRKNKTSRQKAVKEADKWFSLYIRLDTQLEYQGCPFCGKSIEHCFHFFSRVNYATRWEEGNAIGSCAGCNFKMEFAPYPFYKWYADTLGQFALDEMNKKHHTIGKFATEEIAEIAAKYKKLYEDLKGDK